jgi:hypothetical protein
VTAPAYRYRATRSHRGRPAAGADVDEAKVYRAIGGERVALTAPERREAVRRLASTPTNRVAERLDLSWRSVQRIRATIRKEVSDG